MNNGQPIDHCPRRGMDGEDEQKPLLQLQPNGIVGVECDFRPSWLVASS